MGDEMKKMKQEIKEKKGENGKNIKIKKNERTLNDWVSEGGRGRVK
jgi:hypothetical protein